MSRVEPHRWLLLLLCSPLVGMLIYYGLLFPLLPLSPSPERMLTYSAAPTPLSVTLAPENTNQQELDKAERLYEEGKAAFDADRWEDAIESFNKALALNPHHAAAYNFRGAAYRHIGDSECGFGAYLRSNDRAILDFTRAIAADPEWWRPYNNRGNSYKNRAAAEPLRANREQWMALALADYEKAIALDGTQGFPRCNIAFLYVGQKECRLATENSQFCQGEDNYFQRRSLLTSILQCMGEYDQALSTINWGLRDYPTDPYFLWDRGKVYLAAGAYKEAEADFAKAIKVWEGNSVSGMLWYDRAVVAYRLGRFDLVKDYIRHGNHHTLFEWGEPYYYLGMVYLQEGQEKQARDAFLWAEKTLDAGPLLEATQRELAQLGK